MKSRINRDEREISISELWWYIISKWKWLVIGMVIGAMFLGLYGAFKANAFNGNNSAESLVEMKDLAEEEQEEVKALIEEYESYQAELTKLEESYLMNLDFNNVTYYHITYYVDADYSYNYLEVEEDYTKTLISMYKIYLFSDEVYDKIMQLGIEGLEEIDLGYIYNAASEANLIKIGVCADEKWSKVIADAICEAFEAYYPVACELVGEHKVTNVSYDNRITYAENVRNGQNYKNSIVNAMASEIEAQKLMLKEEQLAVYENEISKIEEINVDGSELKLEENHSKNLIDMKYIVVGIITGAAVVAVMVVITYFIGKKLKSISEISQVYRVEILGKILRDDLCNKKIIKKINKIKTTKTENEQKLYVAEMLINKCKSEKKFEIALCSSIKGIADRMSEIVETMENAGISCKVVENISYDSKALNTTVECKNVIIIELLNVTNREDFEAEIDVCDKLSINVLGMIVFI